MGAIGDLDYFKDNSRVVAMRGMQQNNLVGWQQTKGRVTVKVTEANLKFHRSSGEDALRKKMSAQKRTGSIIISQAQDDLMKARCAACIYPTAFYLMPECLNALMPGIVMYHFGQYGNKSMYYWKYCYNHGGTI